MKEVIDLLKKENIPYEEMKNNDKSMIQQVSIPSQENTIVNILRFDNGLEVKYVVADWITEDDDDGLVVLEPEALDGIINQTKDYLAIHHYKIGGDN